MAALKHVTDSQAEWSQGTLSGVVARPDGSLALEAEFEDHFERTTLGPDWEVAPGTAGSVDLTDGKLVLTGGTSRRMWVRTTTPWALQSFAFRARRDDSGADVGAAFNWDGTLRSIGGGEPENGYRLHWRTFETPSVLRLSRYVGGTETSLDEAEFPADFVEHEFAVLVDSGQIKVWVDGALMLQASDTTFTSGRVGLTAREGDTRRGYYDWVRINGGSSGNRTSPIIDLSAVARAARATIAWEASAPSDTSVAIETRLSTDGGSTWGNWQAVTNGGPIPSISAGADLSLYRLQTRVTLETENAALTPTVSSLTISIGETVTRRVPMILEAGLVRTRVAPAIIDAGVVRQTMAPLLVIIADPIALSRRIVARFSVGRPDGQTWEDLTGYLVSATINLGDVTSLGTGTAGIDERVRTAQFELIQERADGLTYSVPHSVWDEGLERDETAIVGDEDTGVGDETDHAGKLIDLLFGLEPETFTSDSLSPRDRASLWNSFGGGYAPLIWPRREVYLEVTILPLGEETGGTTTEWYPLFHGQIDDWKVEGGRIIITCRDMASRLQDLYLLEPAEYGSEQGVPLETVMQQMLDDHLGPGVVQLYCPVSPGFLVTSYVAEYVTLWEALQTLASQTVGWYLGYRWRAETGRFELTLMEPPRDKSVETADYHLTAREDILVNDLGGSIADVRNLIKVTYRDSATGERRSVTVSDQPSIDEYGLRPMAIEEGDTSPIDTEEEARALARAALADLKDQHATTLLELPLLPWLDLMDGLTTEDPRTSSTVDFYAVESVEHRLDWSDPERAVFRTSAVCSGKVAGAHVKWLAMQTRPGAKGEPVPPEAVVGRGRALPRPPAPTVRSIIRGVAVDVPAPHINANRWARTQIVVGSEPGFDPDGAPITAEGRLTHFELADRQPGETLYIRARYVSPSDQASPWSPEVSAVAGKAESSDYGDETVETVHIAPHAVTALESWLTSSTTAQSTNTTWTDIPGFSVAFSLDQDATVLILMRIDARAWMDIGYSSRIVRADFRLVIDGVPVRASRIGAFMGRDAHGTGVGHWYFLGLTSESPGNGITGVAMVVEIRTLSAGEHTIKGQFQAYPAGYAVTAEANDRELGVMLFKR